MRMREHVAKKRIKTADNVDHFLGPVMDSQTDQLASEETEQFRIQWNDHHPILISLLGTLLEKESLGN